MRCLETSYNPEVKKIIEEAIEKANYSKVGRDMICFTMQSIFTLNNKDEPETLRDSWGSFR